MSTSSLHPLVTMVPSATDAIEVRNVPVARILDAIQAGKWREKIDAIGALYQRTRATDGVDPARRAIDPLKKRLPGVLWSGRFVRRRDEGLAQHSGLLVGDLDSLGDELVVIRTKLVACPHVFSIFTSPSGDGLKILFRVPPDPQLHRRSFEAASKWVQDLTGKALDASGKDMARLCFVSFDPALYINESATELTPAPEATNSSAWPEERDGGTPDLTLRQRLAVEVLGKIEWLDSARGRCACPGAHLHTAANGPRDCEVLIDRAITLRCFHQSCTSIRAGVQHELARQIWEAERKAKEAERKATGPAREFPRRGGGASEYIPTAEEAAEAEGTGAERPESSLPPPEPPRHYAPPPLDGFSPNLRAYVELIADEQHVDVAVILLPVLVACAGAIGNTRNLYLRRGYVAPSVLWGAPVMPSGSAKSPALARVLEPIKAIERERIRENATARDAWNTELAKWRAEPPKTRGAEPAEPAARCVLLGDATIPAVVSVLGGNPRGVLLWRDELSEWLGSFGEYTDKDGADLSRWLCLHDGDFLAVNRKTNREHVRIPNPRISIIGGIQPRVLARLLTRDFFERGLPARFLWAMPPVTQSPLRLDSASDESQPEKAWRDIITSLYALQSDENEYGEPCPRLVRLTLEAKQIFEAFYWETQETGLDASDDDSPAWLKLPGQAARLALVLHLAGGHDGVLLSSQTMTYACTLARWFGSEAERISRWRTAKKGERQLAEAAEFIARRFPGGCTPRDFAQYASRKLGVHNQVEAAEKLLRALTRRGYGTIATPDVGEKGGRPPLYFTLSTSTKPPKSKQNEGFRSVDSGENNKTEAEPTPPEGENRARL